ncbi:hypothetical protein FKM82_028059 [Ascaphus truei]
MYPYICTFKWFTRFNVIWWDQFVQVNALHGRQAIKQCFGMHRWFIWPSRRYVCFYQLFSLHHTDRHDREKLRGQRHRQITAASLHKAQYHKSRETEMECSQRHCPVVSSITIIICLDPVLKHS